MAVQINWGLEGRAPDFGQNALASFQAGQDQARQQAGRNALSKYAADPRGSIAELTAIDPAAASQLRQGYVADQQLNRQEQFRAALGKGDLQGATQAAAGDPALMQAMDQMHARMKALNDAQAAGLQAVASLPPEQRAQVWDATVAPRLVALGQAPDAVASKNIDFTDQGITAAARQTMSAKDQLDLTMKQGAQVETQRHNQATEGQASAQLGETGRHNRAAEATSRMEAGAAVSNAATNAKKLTLMANGGGIDPDAIEFYAERNAKDGYLPSLGMGPAAAGVKAAILARSAQLQRGQGLTGADAAATVAGAKANSRALGSLATQSAQVSAAEQTAEQTADLALRLAREGGVGPSAQIFNRPIQQIRGQLSDPKAAAFNNALGTFRDEYAKVLSGAGGQSTDALRHEVDQRINRTMSLPELEHVVSTMKQEMQFRIQSQDAEQANLQGRIKGGGHAPAPAGRPSLDQIFGGH